MTTPFVPRINCDHDINFQEPGHIESPNFGIGNYFPRLRCVWRLFAPDEYIIRLHFVSFYIEYSQSCQYDALTVTEGSVAGGQVLAALCGQISPDDILSSTNSLTLSFISDDNKSAPGFNISYSIENKTGESAYRSKTINKFLK